MARLAWFAVGLTIGAALVAAPAVWLHDPVETAEHLARECRLIAGLERERIAEQIERSRDMPDDPYLLLRAERVAGAPKAFGPRRRSWKLIDAVLAFQGRKAAAPIDCRPALDAAKVPAFVSFSPDKPKTISHSAYSRAVFWPGDRYALITWTPCDLRAEGWDEDRNAMLLRGDGKVWRQVEYKDRLLIFRTRPYRGRAMPCFAG
ncbi:hypothetical protein [Caulobacter sp. LjRoot300]|uniref:hypothetical protein n=1 Tax=Caulobacter sp. LjRoot300 TaxID=3342321 RepID=UPI003ECE53DB